MHGQLRGIAILLVVLLPLVLLAGLPGSSGARGHRPAGAVGGLPRLARTGEVDQSTSDHWDGRFFPPGIDGNGGRDGYVGALAWDDLGGSLYVGGGFRAAAGVWASNVARWDGTSWSALGSGMNNSVEALLWDDAHRYLYAGGAFTMAGGMPANRVARWDGTSWSALGDGTGGAVLALAWDGAHGYLYAGGTFTTAGGMPANLVARWDGSSWSALGSGMVGCDSWDGCRVSALAVDGSGTLYAGGNFSSAGGVPAHYIARWDGASWSALGSGMEGCHPYFGCDVSALAVDGSGTLYAGGGFFSAGGVPADRIAGWDGTSWSALSMDSGLNDWVGALAWDAFQGQLCAGGSFTTAGGVAAGNIACWDGASWSTPGSGTERYGYVYALAWEGTSGSLYAGGEFAIAGDVAASRIARWDGTSWSALGSGSGVGCTSSAWWSTVYALAVGSSGSLYAAGGFRAVGGVVANGVARWDGTSWATLGSGTYGYGQVDALAWDGAQGYLYAGGHFTSVSGVPASNIARWDGTSWSALGTGMDGEVGALAWDDAHGTLYAGGDFATAGGVPASNIARWDGASWSALGSGTDGYGVVNALAWDGAHGYLYAGGDFITAGGRLAYGIARWDGTSWASLGSGMGSWVESLAWDAANGYLYAGGRFTSAGGVPAQHIARWDGTSWAALGSGVEGCAYWSLCVLALALDGSGSLYAGGEFTAAGGAPASHIARWNGSSWAALGSGTEEGMYPFVHSLAWTGPGGLYLGGAFTVAGGKPSWFIARWFNASPVAADDFYLTPPDTPLPVPAPGVLGNDSDPEGDPLTANLLTPPFTGTLILTSSGAFSYTPALGFHGTVTFTYAVNDDVGGSDTATVTMMVAPIWRIYLPLMARE